MHEYEIEREVEIMTETGPVYKTVRVCFTYTEAEPETRRDPGWPARVDDVTILDGERDITGLIDRRQMDQIDEECYEYADMMLYDSGEDYWHERYAS